MIKGGISFLNSSLKLHDLFSGKTIRNTEISFTKKPPRRLKTLLSNMRYRLAIFRNYFHVHGLSSLMVLPFFVYKLSIDTFRGIIENSRLYDYQGQHF